MLGRGVRLNADAVTETAAMAQADAPPGVRVTSHACDVSDEAQVLRFRDELLDGHASDHVDLVFSNAGIGGGEASSAAPGRCGNAPSRWTGGACTTAPARSCRC